VLGHARQNGVERGNPCNYAEACLCVKKKPKRLSYLGINIGRGCVSTIFLDWLSLVLFRVVSWTLFQDPPITLLPDRLEPTFNTHSTAATNENSSMTNASPTLQHSPLFLSVDPSTGPVARAFRSPPIQSVSDRLVYRSVL